MKTYIDVIEETVKYYSQDPNLRSVDHKGNCLYNGPDGKLCAFARYVENPKSLSEGLAVNDNIHCLKDEYTHLDSIEFWDDLRNLHDLDGFWDHEGLSSVGLCEVNRLKNTWK